MFARLCSLNTYVAYLIKYLISLLYFYTFKVALIKHMLICLNASDKVVIKFMQILGYFSLSVDWEKFKTHDVSEADCPSFVST